MKIPKRIKVGGHWVKVEYPYEFQERADCNGIAEVDEKRIRLTDRGVGKYPESSVAETLLHEILHHVCHSATAAISINDDERQHAAFTKALFQVLVDNKLDFRDVKK